MIQKTFIKMPKNCCFCRYLKAKIQINKKNCKFSFSDLNTKCTCINNLLQNEGGITFKYSLSGIWTKINKSIKAKIEKDYIAVKGAISQLPVTWNSAERCALYTGDDDEDDQEEVIKL